MARQQKISFQTKMEILKRYDDGTPVTVLDKEYKLGKNTIYNWVSLRRKGLFVDKKPRVQKPVSDSETLRKALYDSLKEEYVVLETRLKEIHTRMKLVGEEW